MHSASLGDLYRAILEYSRALICRVGAKRHNRAQSRPSYHTLSEEHGPSAGSVVLLSLTTLLEEAELGLVDEGESCSSCEGLDSVHVVTELGRVSLVSISFGTGSANGGADTNDTSVDSARDAVLLLNVDLGE